MAYLAERLIEWAEKLNETHRIEIDEAMLEKANEPPRDFPVIKRDYANKNWMRSKK